MFADQVQQLRDRGMGKKSAMLAFTTRTTIPIEGEWLEAFWCDHCQETRWYHVCKQEKNQYSVAIAPNQLWQQATGALNTEGNPSVSEFTRRNAHQNSLKDLTRYQVVS